MIENEKLLELYNKGWRDEMFSLVFPEWFNSDLEKRAYVLGRLDYVTGDVISSVDNKSDEEIIKTIRE